jgi:hypothetical protein
MSFNHDDFMQAQFRITDLERQLEEAHGKIEAVREKLRIVPQHIAHGSHRPNSQRPCFRCVIETILGESE